MQIADRSCENRRSDGWEVGAVILIFFITVAYHKNDVMRQVPSPLPRNRVSAGPYSSPVLLFMIRMFSFRQYLYLNVK